MHVIQETRKQCKYVNCFNFTKKKRKRKTTTHLVALQKKHDIFKFISLTRLINL